MKRNNNLLKISEAAELLNVYPNTLYQWDKKGILKAICFGERGDGCYKLNEVRNFIKEASK